MVVASDAVTAVDDAATRPEKLAGGGVSDASSDEDDAAGPAWRVLGEQPARETEEG